MRKILIISIGKEIPIPEIQSLTLGIRQGKTFLFQKMREHGCVQKSGSHPTSAEGENGVVFNAAVSGTFASDWFKGENEMRWMMSLVLTGLVMGLASLGMARYEEPKYTIKEVMKDCMKGGLCKKVASGKGTDDDKEKLIEEFTALAANTPPKGEKDSWKKLTGALLKAAKANDGKALLTAANCKACHDVHK